MNIELKHLKLPVDAHKKLRLLAALSDKTMTDVLVELIEEALKTAQASDRPESV
jgi:hypothetical protein